MSDFDERLRAADPAAGMSYQHPDVNAMISRIEARAPLARRHVLRSFKLRMASAVTMAAVLTVGGIAALDGAGPALQVLSLSAAKASPHAPSSFGAASVPKSGMMRIWEEFNFSAGSGLSTTAGSAPSYELSFPANASSEATRLATMFGVTGTPVDTNGDGSDWTVTDVAGDTFDYETYGGVPQWYFNSAPSNASSITTSDGTTAPMPSKSTIEGDVQNYLTQMGYGYSVTDPQYSTSTVTASSPGQPDVTTNEETANFSVTVNGLLTDQSFNITVDSNNKVIEADGPAFTLMPSVNYPLQSPVAGVSVLEAQQKSEFASTPGAATGQGSGSAPLSGTSTGAPVTSPATAPSGTPSDTTTTDPGNATTTTQPSGPPIVDVTLNSVSTSLSSYTLTDGSVWMLPMYTYTGTVTNSDGSSYTGTWTTLAVDPSYVQLPISSSGGINPGGPIMY